MVVVQLLELSLPTIEISASNLVIGNFIYYQLHKNVKPFKGIF